MNGAGEQMLITSASDVIGRPVVTVAGEDVAQVKDVLFDRTGFVTGFALAGRGLLSGPLKEWLPWRSVRGFGPDALIVADDSVLTREGRGDDDGDVLGDEVLTRSGEIIGEVVDAVLRLDGTGLDLVGYEVEPSEGGDPRYLPLPDTISVTGDRLVVPDIAKEYLRDDLNGFGGAVDSFRRRLEDAA